MEGLLKVHASYGQVDCFYRTFSDVGVSGDDLEKYFKRVATRSKEGDIVVLMSQEEFEKVKSLG